VENHSVYWIRHNSHADIFSNGYVGVSKNAPKRFLQHRLGKSSSKHIHHAIKKYGEENIVFEVVLIADKEYCLNIEKQLRPADKIGWNIVTGGGCPPVLRGERLALKGRLPWNKGKKMSLETRAKVSAAAKKQMSDPEHRSLLSRLKLGKPSPAKGRKCTPETIEKIRASKIGKPTKKKGTKLSGAALLNTIAAAQTKWVCPHCKKEGMSKGAANRWHFDSCKHKDTA
jgi:group I intron endonuclease